MTKVADKPHAAFAPSNLSPQKMTELCAIATRVSEQTGVSFPYLMASMYAESTFNPNAKNGEARGIAQIKPGIWKETTEGELYKTCWKTLAPGKDIPKSPGKMVLADVLAMAVITQTLEEKGDVLELKSREMDMARRLRYHLSADTAHKKLRDLNEGRAITFDKPKKCVKLKNAEGCEKSANQKNWDRFVKTLDTARLVEDLTNMFKPI